MTCEIIMDLIPMYADGTASQETRALVQNHVKDCACCSRFLKSCKNTEKKCVFSREKLDRVREKLRGVQNDITSVDAEFARLSLKLKKRKLRRVIISSVLAAGMLAYIVIDIVNAIKKTEKSNGGIR